MCSRAVRVAVCGAAMTAAFAGLSEARADEVRVNFLMWSFYQGGAALEDEWGGEILQDQYVNSLHTSVSRSLSGVSFLSESTMVHTPTVGANVFTFNSAATMFAHAEVDASNPIGVAHAFASLSMYFIEFEVIGASWSFVSGSGLMNDFGEPVAPGQSLEEGIYHFFYSTTALDVEVMALSGESFSQSADAAFNFQFASPVPAPAALAALLPASLLAARRRRRRG